MSAENRCINENVERRIGACYRVARQIRANMLDHNDMKRKLIAIDTQLKGGYALLDIERALRECRDISTRSRFTDMDVAALLCAECMMDKCSVTFGIERLKQDISLLERYGWGLD